MKILRFVVASALLLLAFPLWRQLDWAAILMPIPWVYALSLAVLSLFVFLLPLKLFFPGLSRIVLFSILLVIVLTSFLTKPLSSMGTLEPDVTHCGFSTYTGFLHPFRKILSNSYEDDLELRNQLCWIRKMIQKVPENLDEAEVKLHLDQMRHRLMKPTNKYRVALPAVLFLYGQYLSAWDARGETLQQIQSGRLFSQGLEFWNEQYAEEISAREYSSWEWPHSAWIKFEYGLIEKNWEKIKFESDE